MQKLQRQFFYQLEKTIKNYRQFAQIQLRENGFNITVDQWLVLKTASENPGIAQVELAEMVFKDKASITRILDILISRGYIRKESSEYDKRQQQISITKKGKDLIEQVTPVVLQYRKEAMSGLTEEEIKITENVLKTIAENSLVKLENLV